MAKFAKQKKPIKFQTPPVIYEDGIFNLSLEITVSIAQNAIDDAYTAVLTASLKSGFGKVTCESCFVALEELCDWLKSSSIKNLLRASFFNEKNERVDDTVSKFLATAVSFKVQKNMLRREIEEIRIAHFKKP